MHGQCDYAEMEWYCVLAEGHKGPHRSAEISGDARSSWGRTRSGKPITEELVAELAEKAERGYPVVAVRRRGTVIWLVADLTTGDVRTMEHEGDYVKGDTLVCVGVSANGGVTVDVLVAKE